MCTAPCNWKQYLGAGVRISPFPQPVLKKIQLTQKQRSHLKKKKYRGQSHFLGCTLHIYRGRCSMTSRVVFKGSITKYTKVFFLFTVHKRTLPHFQMRHYKTSHYLLYVMKYSVQMHGYKLCRINGSWGTFIYRGARAGSQPLRMEYDGRGWPWNHTA